MKTVLTAADWTLLQEIFNQAVELPPEPRAVYLDTACRERPDLRARVEALVRSALNEENVIASAIADAAEEHAAASLPGPGDRIGHYQIIRVVGRGGMGIVYEAVRADDQYEKKVAIKLVAAGLLTQDLLPRFRAERQILANLDHPNVARLLDGGTTEVGLPYVVLEYVDGKPLDAYCDEHKLDTPQRLKLLVEIARAVQYAHQNLVVHRDLKPGNILITPQGVPKLLDFGIAKLLQLEAGSPDQPLTVETTRMMTPEYASPEQLAGRPVSTTTDVYQLGVILYELLAGRRPFRAEDLPLGELERAICQQAPARLAVDADLDRIAQKTLEKEPQHRYPSASELADDLERYLGGFPVRARPASWRYRSRKFIRRNRTWVAAASVFLLVILGFGASMAVLARRARTEAATAKQVTDFMVGLFDASDPDHGGADKITARDLLDKGVGRIDSQLKENPAVQARLYDTIGSIYSNLGLFQQARDILAKALTLRNKLGIDDESAASTLSSLGELSFELGNFQDCEKYYREAARLHLAAGGPKNLALVADYSALAGSLNALNRLAEAEEFGQRALDLSIQLHGRVNAETALAMNNLKSILLLRGDYVKAEKLARDAYEIRKQISPEGRDLAMFEGNLAYVLGMLGRFQEAETHARQAYALVLRAMGDGTPGMAYRRIVLAKVLLSTGKFPEALALSRQGFEMQTKLLGAAHRDTSFGAETYALALLAAGEAAQALPICGQSRENRIRGEGADHPDVGVAAMICGEIQLANGNLNAAAELFQEANRIREKRYGRRNALFAESEISMADVLNQRGRYPAARQLLQDALTTLGTDYPEGHPETARARLQLAIGYLKENSSSSAVPLLEQAYAATRAAYGPSHPRTAQAGIWLAEGLSEAPALDGRVRPRIRQLLAEHTPVINSAGPSVRVEHPMIARLQQLP